MLRFFKYGVVATFVLAATGLASAADMQKKASDPRNDYASANTFAGFYLGVHGGYAWSNLDLSTLGMTKADTNFSPDSFVYGLQAGYNWQVGRFVPGIEFDFSLLNKRETVSTGGRSSIAGDIQYIGSARAKLGFALSDIWMLYGTGGVAWGHAAVNISNGVTALELSNVHYGWAAGLGSELEFASHWLLRAEYLHYDLGKSTYLILPAKMSLDVARVGLSYKF